MNKSNNNPKLIEKENEMKKTNENVGENYNSTRRGVVLLVGSAIGMATMAFWVVPATVVTLIQAASTIGIYELISRKKQ